MTSRKFVEKACQMYPEVEMTPEVEGILVRLAEISDAGSAVFRHNADEWYRLCAKFSSLAGSEPLGMILKSVALENQKPLPIPAGKDIVVTYASTMLVEYLHWQGEGWYNYITEDLGDGRRYFAGHKVSSREVSSGSVQWLGAKPDAFKEVK